MKTQQELEVMALEKYKVEIGFSGDFNENYGLGGDINLHDRAIYLSGLQAMNELQGESYSVELIDEFAIKCYGKDDLSPIERNVLDDFIKFLKTKTEKK